MPLHRAPRCPQCGSRDGVREIDWGFPAPELDQSKYVMGGCCISDDDPEWACIECGHDWGIAAHCRPIESMPPVG